MTLECTGVMIMQDYTVMILQRVTVLVILQRGTVVMMLEHGYYGDPRRGVLWL